MRSSKIKKKQYYLRNNPDVVPNCCRCPSAAPQSRRIVPEKTTMFMYCIHLHLLHALISSAVNCCGDYHHPVWHLRTTHLFIRAAVAMHKNNRCTIEFHIACRFGQMALRVCVQIIAWKFLIFTKMYFLLNKLKK